MWLGWRHTSVCCGGWSAVALSVTNHSPLLRPHGHTSEKPRITFLWIGYSVHMYRAMRLLTRPARMERYVRKITNMTSRSKCCHPETYSHSEYRSRRGEGAWFGMLPGDTTIPGTVLALFVPIWSHVKPNLLDISYLPIQENLQYVCQTGAENIILITFFKIFPTQSMQYTNKGQYQFITVTWAVGVMIEKTYVLGCFINKPYGAGPSDLPNNHIWRRERVCLSCFIAPMISLMLCVNLKCWYVQDRPSLFNTWYSKCIWLFITTEI